MELAAVEVGLEAQVSLSSQHSLLPSAPIRCRVYPMVLLLPKGLKCSIKSGMEGLNQGLNQGCREPHPPDMLTVSSEQLVGDQEGIQRGVAGFAWEFLKRPAGFSGCLLLSGGIFNSPPPCQGPREGLRS